MALKRSAEDASMHHLRDEVMKIMPIGAGNEVGRSCIILEYKGRTVMLDCGIHPGYKGVAALPFFDEIDPEEIDLLLISHFHLDHAASLPYFTEKTGFKGKIFMTHPTRAVMGMLLKDYVKLNDASNDESYLFTEQDLINCVKKIELIDYHQVLEHEGIRFWCYNAGHVLGAAMFMLEIGGVHVLYTGDYSLENDRHLMAAEIPGVSPDVLIVESTFGLKVHSPRAEREARFTGLVEKVIRRGGRCLIPVFALGRAQELLLILDEYWQTHKDLQEVPIYYASQLATKALRVYQTYINMMNAHIRQQMDVHNPFRFQFISNWRGSIEDYQDIGPAVMMASPGMLQNGLSRKFFDQWCSNPKNGIIIPGFAVEGTLAKRIMSEPDEVTGLDGRVRPLNASVESISFAAHVDYAQNTKFITSVNPDNIILVHGEAMVMQKLKGGLTERFRSLPSYRRPTVKTPKNCQPVVLEFHREKLAKVVGKMAEKFDDQDTSKVTGLFVSKDFEDRLVAEEDLDTYTQVKIGGVSQRLHVPFFMASGELLGKFFREVFADVSETQGQGFHQFTVQGLVRASVVKNKLLLEWEANPVADSVADALIALCMQAQCSPGGLMHNSRPCAHRHMKPSNAITGNNSIAQTEDGNDIPQNKLHPPACSDEELIACNEKGKHQQDGMGVDKSRTEPFHQQNGMEVGKSGTEPCQFQTTCCSSAENHAALSEEVMENILTYVRNYFGDAVQTNAAKDCQDVVITVREHVIMCKMYMCMLKQSCHLMVIPEDESKSVEQKKIVEVKVQTLLKQLEDELLPTSHPKHH